VQVDNVSALRLLNRCGTALNAVDRNGSSALHVALRHAHRNSALFLIDAGAAVNRPRRYDSGETPLHFAARLGDNVVLAAALRRGAGRPDVQSSDGTTPLHVAARERHSACVDLLCASAASRQNANCNYNLESNRWYNIIVWLHPFKGDVQDSQGASISQNTNYNF